MRHSSSSWFGQLGLILGLSVALSGCAVDPRDAGDDIVTGTPGGNESDRCVRGETRCYGGALQSCDSGTYKTSKVCGTGQICDPKRGCLDCSPVLPTTCVGDKVHICNADGSIGTEQETCQPKACSGGRCSTVCSPGSELIYVVDSDNRLLSFNPRDGKYEFKLIGTLSCPAGSSFGGGKATPFSMAVDRQARAWVLYSSGEIFWVSTTDASCKSSGFAKNQSSFETFGMGFVSDAEGSEK